MTQVPEPVTAMMLAMDKNRLIGSDGKLPWHIPGELAYFKSVTMGKPIIMGRKTFDSMGRPLPGRPNIVVTRNEEWRAEGVHTAAALDEALSLGAGLVTDATSPEVIIIGGAALCRDAMPRTQRLYLTVVDHEYEGDTWLDSFQWEDWQVISEDVRDPVTTGGLPVTYWVLEKPVKQEGISGS